MFPPLVVVDVNFLCLLFLFTLSLFSFPLLYIFNAYEAMIYFIPASLLSREAR